MTVVRPALNYYYIISNLKQYSVVLYFFKPDVLWPYDNMWSQTCHIQEQVHLLISHFNGLSDS